MVSGQTSPAPATSKVKTTEEAYKNIQTLKGIPADQLIPAMQFITYSLGVECSFCHVEGAFEKDDKKPKEAARKMMQMMFAINQQNFDGKREVTCYSCHRGSAHPVATPIIADAGAPAVADVAAQSRSTTRRTTTAMFLRTYLLRIRFLPSMRTPSVARQPSESCPPGSKTEPSVSAGGNSLSIFSAKFPASE